MLQKTHSELLQKMRANPAPYQEMRTALQIIGDKWSGLILLSLLEKPCRFTDIETILPGLSPRTLSKRLKMLEDSGLITRRDFKEFPPRIVYAPTQKAFELKAAMSELKKWAKKYCKEPLG